MQRRRRLCQVAIAGRLVYPKARQVRELGRWTRLEAMKGLVTVFAAPASWAPRSCAHWPSEGRGSGWGCAGRGAATVCPCWAMWDRSRSSRPTSATMRRWPAPSTERRPASTRSRCSMSPGRQTFADLHVEGARRLALAARAQGARRFAYISAWAPTPARRRSTPARRRPARRRRGRRFPRPSSSALGGVRPRRSVLQPLRRHGHALSGTAFDRRRDDAVSSRFSSAMWPPRSPRRWKIRARAH